MVKRSVEIARKEGAKRVVATMLPDNEDMQAIFKRQGFRMEKMEGKDLLRAELDLR